MQRTYPAGLWQIGFCVSGFMWDVFRWRSLQIFSGKLSPVIRVAAGSSGEQFGAGGFRCDATVTPSANQIQLTHITMDVWLKGWWIAF